MLALRAVGPRLVLALALGGLVLGGCGANSAPTLDALDAQVAAVGDELTVQLRAIDADGDEVSFSFACDVLPDLAERPLKPEIVE